MQNMARDTRLMASYDFSTGRYSTVAEYFGIMAVMKPDRNDIIFGALEEDRFLREQLAVSEMDYRAAINSLIEVAESDTSGGRAAAQVLLSLYNGYEYHMDLVDLGVLDLRNFQQALIAMRGRVILSIEPHQIIQDGAKRFERLAERWAHLNVEKRYISEHPS